MDLRMGAHFSITSASLSAFDTIAIIILVPIYDRLLIPLLRRYNMAPTYLQRIGIGLGVSRSADCVAAARLAWLDLLAIYISSSWHCSLPPCSRVPNWPARQAPRSLSSVQVLLRKNSRWVISVLQVGPVCPTRCTCSSRDTRIQSLIRDCWQLPSALLSIDQCWAALHCRPLRGGAGPCGTSRLMLLLPTKFCAMPTIVLCRLCSPWW